MSTATRLHLQPTPGSLRISSHQVRHTHLTHPPTHPSDTQHLSPQFESSVCEDHRIMICASIGLRLLQTSFPIPTSSSLVPTPSLPSPSLPPSPFPLLSPPSHSEAEHLLKAEHVAPVVAYLCHESCEDNGGLFEVKTACCIHSVAVKVCYNVVGYTVACTSLQCCPMSGCGACAVSLPSESCLQLSAT